MTSFFLNREEQKETKEIIIESSRNLGDAGAIKLANQLKTCFQIRHINISDNGITTRGFIGFLRLLRIVKIESLNISFNEIDDGAVYYLLNRTYNIKSLDIAGNLIAEDNLIHLESKLQVFTASDVDSEDLNSHF